MQQEELHKYVESSPELKAALSIIQGEIARLKRQEKDAAHILGEMLDLSPRRPKSWRRGSIASYYTEEYANWLKHFVLWLENEASKMSISGKVPQMFIDRKKEGCGPVTLTQRVLQGWRWLEEHGSEEERLRWKELHSRIECARVTGGILLKWKLPRKLNKEAEITEAHDKRGEQKWRFELDEFISKAEDNKKLLLEGLHLSEDQLEYVKNLVSMSPGIFVKEVSEVKIELLKNMALWNKYMGGQE